MRTLITFELKSFLSNRMAIFWTMIYPVAMLSLLIFLFDPGIPVSSFIESYRFQTTIGLVSLTIASTALFGMAQAMSEMRSNRALIPYLHAPMSIFSVVSSILLSRIVVIFVFSACFIVVAFIILNIQISVHPIIILQTSVSVLVTSLFCFALALPLVLMSKNVTTVIAIANIMNVYAIMSSGVFIPLRALPESSAAFITTSPFHYLNIGMQTAFVPASGIGFWLIHAGLAVLGIAIVYASSNRRILVPAL